MLVSCVPMLRSAGVPLLVHVRHFAKQQLATEVDRMNQELDELFGRQFVPFQPLESPFLKLPSDIELNSPGSDASLTETISTDSVTFVDSSGMEAVVKVSTQSTEVSCATPAHEPTPWIPPSADVVEQVVQSAMHSHPLESPFLKLPSDIMPPDVMHPAAPSPTAAAATGQVLTHVDSKGAASMVDVGEKPDTERMATASGRVHLGREAFALVQANQIEKGDVLTVAKLAGMMGAKHTSLLIPLCHNINLTQVDVQLQLDAVQHAVHIHGVAKTVGKTGVEMEALTAVSVAALTVYDMCKAVSKDLVIGDIRLESKSGGRSGEYQRES